MQTHGASGLSPLKNTGTPPSVAHTRDRVQQSAILRTQGEIEADACEVGRRYAIEYTGRGPKEIRAYLLDDLLVVRMNGVLTVAEQQLSTTSTVDGKQLVKRIRSRLIAIARNEIEAMIRICTSVNVKSLHHDISTATGEEILVFTLERAPPIRVAKRK
jgi:uncharacterized protein YbcI